MKFFILFITTFFFISSSFSSTESVESIDNFPLTKSDHIIAEHMINVMKFVEKGYVNQEVINRVIRETEKSKNFQLFVPWLKSVQQISKLNTVQSLISFCTVYSEKKETLPLERVLERSAGNYCREKTLEAISRDIDKQKRISEDATLFIQQNLKFLLTKKNRHHFASFIQSQVTRPEIIKKISQDITTYSVSHEIVPSQEVLKDIVINEQITKLIQDKGFNPLQHQNVFYAEYGKLIELGYKTLDAKSNENKVKDHYKFLKNYLELNQDHLPVGLCLGRLNDFAKSVFRAGFKDLAQDIYKFIIKKNDPEVTEDAQFYHLWTHLYTNEYKDAYKVANSYGLIKKSKQIIDPRLKFWIANIHDELSETGQAISLFEDIVINNPLSYYGIMSSKRLQILKPDSQAVKFYFTNSTESSEKNSVHANQLDEDYISSLIRLKAWARVDSARFIKIELKRLNNHSMPSIIVKTSTEKQTQLKSDLHLLNAQIIQKSNNYLAAFRYLYDVLNKKEINFNRQLLEVLYPRPYLDDLSKALKNDRLDPLVVLALIRQESVFNPLARSPVGARGLMQLMPKTAQRFRRSVRENQLANPQINIDLGTKYFKNLLKRYDGNLVYVLSAYNAGESRVEKWKNLYFETDESIIKNIEAIPFLETRNYVKLIFRNIYFYKLLLDKNQKIVDTSEVNKIFDINLGFNK